MKADEKCKYNCTNGRLFDTNTQSWVPCPECKDKKIVELNTKDNIQNELFGVDSGNLTGVFVLEAVIPKEELNFMEQKELDILSNEVKSLQSKLTLGKKIEKSYCFGVGVKGNITALVYPLQKSAYTAGLTVARLITALGLTQKILKQDFLDEYFSSDLCIVLVNEGCSKADVASCKGLMQERASRGLATIFVTTWSVEACSNLLGYQGDSNLFLASPYFIRYKYADRQSRYINDLYGVKNESLELDLDF